MISQMVDQAITRTTQVHCNDDVDRSPGFDLTMHCRIKNKKQAEENSYDIFLHGKYFNGVAKVAIHQYSEYLCCKWMLLIYKY